MFEKVLLNYGFDHIGYAVISNHPGLNNSNIPNLATKNNIKGWDQHYLDNNYHTIDPVLTAAHSNAGFFTWDDVTRQENLSKKQIEIFREAKEFKLHNGINVSIHSAYGVKCLLIAASSKSDLHIDQYIIDSINLISYQFNTCFLSLMAFLPSMSKVKLTIKEKEILKWASQGLSYTEIGKTLNISRHTVNYHTRNIFRKLHVKNITAALVIAIKEGLIII